MRQLSDRKGMHWIFDRESFAKLRKERGYSHAELAKLLGVTLNTIYAWESGGKMPTSNKVKDIATILKVSVERIAFDREQIYNNIKEDRLLYESIKDELDDKYTLAIKAAYLCIKELMDAKNYDILFGKDFADEVKQMPIANDIIKYSIPMAASILGIYQEKLGEIE